jgi:DNA-binding NtrC family response regulator
MTLRMQGLLLRFLETGELQKVGSERQSAVVNVRVIAATNRNLRHLIDQGQFREDLYYRLNVIHLAIPPLRDRRADIPALVEHFLDKFAQKRGGSRQVTFAPEAIETLTTYAWPGNVRELENVIERLLVTAPGDIVTVRDLPLELQAPRNLSLRPKHERRRTVADDLYKKLVDEGESFWTAVYPLYMQREITRGHMRDLVRKGLENARGNYKIVARLFNMEQRDYKRFLNFAVFSTPGNRSYGNAHEHEGRPRAGGRRGEPRCAALRHRTDVRRSARQWHVRPARGCQRALGIRDRCRRRAVDRLLAR